DLAPFGRSLAAPPVVVAQSQHAALEERVVLDREQARLVGPVLEDATAGEQARDVRLGVGADARGERDPVRAVDGGDRVQLDGAELSDLAGDVVGGGAAEAAGVSLPGDDVPPQRGDADRQRWWARYSSRSERVTTPTGRPSRATSTAFERPVSAVTISST